MALLQRSYKVCIPNAFQSTFVEDVICAYFTRSKSLPLLYIIGAQTPKALIYTNVNCVEYNIRNITTHKTQITHNQSSTRTNPQYIEDITVPLLYVYFHRFMLSRCYCV